LKKTKDQSRPFLSHMARRKLEVLAPAGSLATLAAAVDAGADAVYLGLKEFSARAFAENFSLTDLARLVPVAHERGVKVYIAINALFKEEDLLPAARTLEALVQIKPDALILQDLGLLNMIKKHFPILEVHASTLMGCHNLSGLRILEKLGFDRAILARELTLKEIKALSQNTDLGLEVFVHGALCFCFSGLCLMSSFLGGKGSLRGACTQPCRRRYTSGRRTAYFFSPTDLDAAELIRSMKNLNLAAIKIEGRMKGAHYVSTVVKAYRILVDASEENWEQALAEARSLIEKSLGRKGSKGFLLSSQPADALAPDLSPTSGLYLGRIKEPVQGGGRIKLKSEVMVGDRLRAQFKRGGERQAFTLKAMIQAESKIKKAAQRQEVVLNSPFPLSSGDLIFKVDSARGEKESLRSPFIMDFKKAPLPRLKASQNLNRILNDFKPRSRTALAPTGRSRPEAWYRVARTEEVSDLSELKPGRIILPLTRSNLKRAMKLKRRRGHLFERVIWALPPLLFGPEAEELRQDLTALKRMNFAGLMISNLGHLDMLSQSLIKRPGRRLKIYADHRLNCLNTQAEAQLKVLGLDGVTLSVENDEKGLRRILSRPGPIARLLYIYGRPPLFTSRFNPAGLRDNLPVLSSRRERFRLYVNGGICQVFAEQPMFLSPLLKFKSLAGVKAFIIDLEFDPHPRTTAREVREAIRKGRPIKGSSKFNLRRGLH